MSKPLRNITTLDGSDFDRIDPRTVTERYSNFATANVIGHTQVWTFPEGDAIALVTNKIGEPSAGAVIIRVGDKVATIPCHGLTAAMAAMGLDPKEYEVQ